MIRFQRLFRLTALVCLGAAAAGCVVVPYGGHRGHGHYRSGAYVAPPPPTVVIEGDYHRGGRGRR